MLFNSLEFFIFFGVVFSAYALMGRHFRLQNKFLLCASYFFYGWWDERFLFLIAVATAANYVAAFPIAGIPLRRDIIEKTIAYMLAVALVVVLINPASVWLIAPSLGAFFAVGGLVLWGLYASAPERRPGRALASVIVLTLGILAYFKYANFFMDSAQDALGLLGVTLNDLTISVILPVGISFYTFQTMSYSIDVQRRHVKPTTSLIELATYIAFFPQLVAGPIERAHHFLPQFFRRREITGERMASGLALAAWGLYKKVVIADNLALITQPVFADPASHSSGGVLVGVIAFGFQIYCDFSGYSDIARGIARAMGFDLMLNFNLPYFSRTPSEFWRRWHISLSSWLRDYLYIPLGGNRGGAVGTYRNLMLTMVLGGLWHGAAWTFVIWGFIHGLVLIIYRVLNLDAVLDARPMTGRRGLDIGAIALHLAFGLAMYGVVHLAWIFFRAEGIDNALAVLSQLASFDGWEGRWAMLAFFVTPLFIAELIQRNASNLEVYLRWPSFVQYNAALFLVCSLLFLKAPKAQEFIYFDF